jgi:acid stress-induced BolA-like protein IbaG/YrbA
VVVVLDAVRMGFRGPVGPALASSGDGPRGWSPERGRRLPGIWVVMSDHPTSFTGSVPDAISDSIRRALPDALVAVTGGGGHYAIVVTSAAFDGKGMLESQRLVYSAIAHLMKGDSAPVHAVDTLRTLKPVKAP